MNFEQARERNRGKIMGEHRIEGCTFFGKPGSIAINLEQEDQLYIRDTIINAELAPRFVWRVIKRCIIPAAFR
jgi:hypothetical protein